MAGHPLKYAALTQRGRGRVLLDGRYHTSLAANTHRLASFAALFSLLLMETALAVGR